MESLASELGLKLSRQIQVRKYAETEAYRDKLLAENNI